MIEGWVKQINPKAILRAADARCGARFAVYVVPEPGEFGTRCTEYLPLEQLEQYLLGVFYADEFNQKMGEDSITSPSNRKALRVLQMTRRAAYIYRNFISNTF